MSDLLSLSRLARRLGVTQQWLRDQAEAGRIPCLKAGDRYLFNPAAVQEALAAKAARMRQGGDDAK
jgi:excisionase family DNA binding protein